MAIVQKQTQGPFQGDAISESEKKAREDYARQLAESQRLQNEIQRMRMPDYQEQAKMDRSRAEREKDMAAGQKRGQELFAEGALGRLDTETVARLRAESKGFSAEEQNAMREQNLGTINQANQAAQRALRIQQAAQGVRGAQAVAQANKLRQDQGNQVAQSERELFLKNIDARRTGLQSDIAGQQYNIQQANREKQAQLATELGYGSLGSAERGAVLQSIVGEKQAQATQNSGGGGKK